MGQREMQRLLALVERLSRAQRQELLDKLRAQATASEAIELVESVGGHVRGCPHCASSRVVRNGLADGLQRYKCRACGKTFNALTGTPLARLRHKGKWLEQARAMADGLTGSPSGRALGRGGQHRLPVATQVPCLAQGSQAYGARGRC